MTAMALAQMQPHVELPFLINDADNHFVEPRDLYVNYVDPKWRHKAVTFEADDQGRWIGVFGGGRPVSTRRWPWWLPTTRLRLRWLPAPCPLRATRTR